MDKNASFGSLRGMDALSRRLPTEDEVGALRQERYVGVFFFLTHTLVDFIVFDATGRKHFSIMSCSS